MKVEAFIANSSHSKSNLYENNSKSRSNQRSQVNFADEECFYRREMGHIQYPYKKIKDLLEYKQFKKVVES